MEAFATLLGKEGIIEPMTQRAFGYLFLKVHIHMPFCLLSTK